MNDNEEERQPSTGWPESDGQWPMRPVQRLIYASVSQVEGSVLDEMRRIREHAVRNNAPHGLRVALLHMGGCFVEWIEGPGHAIDGLLERVSRDWRHHSLRVIHRSAGQARLKRPWIGAIVQASEGADDFAARLQAWHRRHEAGEEHEPARVWLDLCSPPAHDMPRSGEGFQRAMLLSARRAEAFDLLHWLSVVSARQLVRRRFAASAEDVSDVESDYLDLPALGDGGVRLIANARRGLAMGVAHAFMPDHEAIVLILDEDADANVRLVDRVLDVCRQTRHAPAIIGLGTHGSVTGELQDRVEVQGHAWVGARSRLMRPEMADFWEVLEPVLDRLGR